MIDVAEAIDVALTLLRGAVWTAAAIGLVVSVLLLLSAWAVTSCVKAARRAWARIGRHARQTPTGAPHSPSRGSRVADTPPSPSSARTAPRWTEAA